MNTHTVSLTKKVRLKGCFKYFFMYGYLPVVCKFQRSYLTVEVSNSFFYWLLTCSVWFQRSYLTVGFVVALQVSYKRVVLLKVVTSCH